MKLPCKAVWLKSDGSIRVVEVLEWETSLDLSDPSCEDRVKIQWNHGLSSVWVNANEIITEDVLESYLPPEVMRVIRK